MIVSVIRIKILVFCLTTFIKTLWYSSLSVLLLVVLICIIVFYVAAFFGNCLFALFCLPVCLCMFSVFLFTNLILLSFRLFYIRTSKSMLATTIWREKCITISLKFHECSVSLLVLN